MLATEQDLTSKVSKVNRDTTCSERHQKNRVRIRRAASATKLESVRQFHRKQQCNLTPAYDMDENEKYKIPKGTSRSLAVFKSQKLPTETE